MLKIGKKIEVEWQLIALFLLGLIFFLVYSFLAFKLPLSWTDNPKLVLNSPDETSNLFFSHLYAYQSVPQFKDVANEIAGGLVAPRSMRVINGQTAPASFLGLPIIYGFIAKIIGVGFIPFLTPAIAVIGLLFFYLLIKEIFNKETAFIAALLGFILPAYWYYSTKGLFPNVAFVSFFIIALYFFIKIIKGLGTLKPFWQLAYYGLAGVFLALTLMVRTSEIVWIIPLFVILAAIHWRRLRLDYLFFALIVCLLVFSPVFFINQRIYGSPLSIGYSLALELKDKNLLEQGVTFLEKMFLPFGFNLGLIFKNLFNYTFKLFPLWTGLSLMMVALYLLTLFSPLTFRKKNTLYLALYGLFSAYLVIYYGSWPIWDNPDPNAVTIGTSFVRYWLLPYLFILPIWAWVFSFYLKKIKYPLAVILFGVLAVNAFQLVMLDKSEGIFKVRQNLEEYQQIAAQVVAATETNAVIISERMDKVFFPARRVIYKLNQPADYQNAKKLLENDYPVYYFNFTLNDETLRQLNENFYEPQGLKVNQSLLDFKNQSLYPIGLK